MEVDQAERCVVAIERATKKAVKRSTDELLRSTKKEKKFKDMARLIASRNFIVFMTFVQT